MNSKKKIFLSIFVSVVLFFIIIPNISNAEFVPYDVPVNEREILGNEQYFDTEVNKTFIKYNYVGQVVNTDDTILAPNITITPEGKTKVYAGDVFTYSNLNWHTLEYATTTIEEFNELYSPITKTLGFVKVVYAEEVFQDSGANMYCYNGSRTWSVCRDSLATADNFNSASTGYNINTREVGTNNYLVNAGYLGFDMSALSGTVESAEFYFTAYNFQTNRDVDGLLIPGTFTISGLANTDWTSRNFASSTELMDNSSYSLDTEYSVSFLDPENDIILGGENNFVFVSELLANNNPPTSSNTTGFGIYSVEVVGTDKDPYILLTIEGEEEEETASSTYISIEDFRYSDFINVITGKTEIYTDSTTTPSEIRYTYFHIPFILWIIVCIPVLFVANILLVEWKIRLRNINK